MQSCSRWWSAVHGRYGQLTVVVIRRLLRRIPTVAGSINGVSGFAADGATKHNINSNIILTAVQLDDSNHKINSDATRILWIPWQILFGDPFPPHPVIVLPNNPSIHSFPPFWSLCQAENIGNEIPVCEFWYFCRDRSSLIQELRQQTKNVSEVFSRWISPSLRGRMHDKVVS